MEKAARASFMQRRIVAFVPRGATSAAQSRRKGDA
jgi:hypothetical protein